MIQRKALGIGAEISENEIGHEIADGIASDAIAEQCDLLHVTARRDLPTTAVGQDEIQSSMELTREADTETGARVADDRVAEPVLLDLGKAVPKPEFGIGRLPFVCKIL